MPLIDHLLAIGGVRRKIWQLWYPFLTRRLRADDACGRVLVHMQVRGLVRGLQPSQVDALAPWQPLRTQRAKRYRAGSPGRPHLRP